MLKDEISGSVVIRIKLKKNAASLSEQTTGKTRDAERSCKIFGLDEENS